MRVRGSDADRLARFAALARPTVGKIVEATRPAQAAVPDLRREHADRIVWHWRTEVGALTALPGVAGRFGGPVRDVLAATAQGVLVLSLARLCGVEDTFTQVRLLTTLVLDDELPAGWTPPPATEVPAPEVPAPGMPGGAGSGDTWSGEATAGGTPGVDPAAEDVAIDGTAYEQAQWVRFARRMPAGFARLAREMWAVRRLVDGRAEGRLWHRAVANVPAVGLLGATLGERHAAAEIAERAYVALGIATELPGI